MEDDKLTIYPLCKTCQEKIIVHGQAKIWIEEDVVII